MDVTQRQSCHLSLSLIFVVFQWQSIATVLLFIITPNGSTHKTCKSIYKYTHNTQYKKKLQIRITVHVVLRKITVSTKCCHRLLFSSAEHKLLMEYFDNILPYWCVHVAEKTVLHYYHTYGFSLWTVIYADQLCMTLARLYSSKVNKKHFHANNIEKFFWKHFSR